MYRHAALAFVAILSGTSACGGGQPPPDELPPDGFDRSALLANLSTNVFLPWHQQAAETIGALPAAIEAHCTQLETQGATAETSLAAARAAFGAAIDAWETTEGVLVGPATDEMNTLRGFIYGWPNLSPCEIDKDVAARWNDPSAYDVGSELVSTRSLAAIEYLLFPPGPSHNCVGAPPGWDSMGTNVAVARCRLAHTIADDVAAHATSLSTQWETSYAAALANAGSGSPITTAQAGVNLVSDGMFYVDKMVKDMKLGEASGIAMNACGTIEEPCLREVELRYSDRATFAIRANLAALRQVFTGGVEANALGFDDYLTAVGHGELATRMLGNLDAAIAKAAALPESYVGALVDNRAEIVALHGTLRLFTEDLKSQFLTVLALDIPDDVAADND